MHGIRRGGERALDGLRAVGDIVVELARYLAASPHSRLRQWQALCDLDDRLLADIGLTRSDVRIVPMHSPRADEISREDEMAGVIENVVIRDASELDMVDVQHIYAHHVLHGLATFEEVPPSADEMARRRDAVVAAGLPYLVAVVDGHVAGYCYATPYRPRPAYRYTIEDSVYVSEASRGRRIGGALLGELIARCERGPWRQMLAVVGNSGNAGSIALHRSLGFRPAGSLTSVGFKLGQWVDTVLMQRALGPGDERLPADPEAGAVGGG